MKVNLNQHHHLRLLMVIDRVTANGVMLTIITTMLCSSSSKLDSAYVRRPRIQLACA